MPTERTRTSNMYRYNFYLPRQHYDALTRAAEKRGVSRSELLRVILTAAFKLDKADDQTPSSQ